MIRTLSSAPKLLVLLCHGAKKLSVISKIISSLCNSMHNCSKSPKPQYGLILIMKRSGEGAPRDMLGLYLVTSERSVSTLSRVSVRRTRTSWGNFILE